MFIEFQNIIIAFVVVLLVVGVFFIVKGKEKKDKSEEIESVEVVEDAYDSPEEIQEEVADEVEVGHKVEEESIENSLDGSEEGDFGETPKVKPSETQTPKEDTPPVKTIHRRDVPKHGKITKQHFSEFSGERVLVAEDNLINQKVLTGLLAGSGIDIVIANDGQEALDILEKDDNFLMVLMDAHMPIVDGFEATRAIRATPKYDHILVVALSGDTASDDIAKMKEAGMAEQLEKPLRMDSLYDILYAYTGEAKGQDSENYVEVVMTKELNGDKGLQVCGGDEHFYREILNEFITTYAHSDEQLSKLLHAHKVQEADKLLLDIIGITANIGAEPLHLIANDIKSALHDTDEKSYLTLAEQYEIHLLNLVEDIQAYK